MGREHLCIMFQRLRGHGRARLSTPKPGAVVPRRGYHQAAIGTEFCVVDQRVVRRLRGHELSGVSVPDLGSVILARGDNAFAIPAESRRPYLPLMSEGVKKLARRRAAKLGLV